LNKAPKESCATIAQPEHSQCSTSQLSSFTNPTGDHPQTQTDEHSTAHLPRTEKHSTPSLTNNETLLEAAEPNVPDGSYLIIMNHTIGS